MHGFAPGSLCNLHPKFFLSRPLCPSTHCGASKGFGDSAPPPPPKSSKGKRKSKNKGVSGISSDQAVERAVRIAEGGKARPVSDEEAAKGRLDYVQVKNWGSGSREDLGGLEVDSVTTVSSDPSRPFYEQLARHLELCQARGDLAPPKGEKPHPPFEKWSFKKRHFVQYLADQMQVHHALEAATLAALQPYREGLPDDIDASNLPDLVMRPEELGPAFNTRPCAALALFTNEAGFARAGQIGEDLHTIAQHTDGDVTELVVASPHANDFADHLVALASVTQDEKVGVEMQDAARLQLLAYIYSMQVAHLTTGMRIGAAAAERLDLLSIEATNLYSTYPEFLGDPLHAFMERINGIGVALESTERDVIFGALPLAFMQTSRLLTALARTD